MKQDISHLTKYRFVLQTQEKKILRQIAEIQKKQGQEKHKYDMLTDCLLETRNNLLSQAKTNISALTFQQFQNFINQLEKALAQQSEVLKNLAGILEKQMVAYKEIKYKDQKVSELLVKINQDNHFQANRKENQENTEIFNRLNRFK